MKQAILLALLLIPFLLICNCNHGLAPSDSEVTTRTGIRGVITYEDNWPPPDSLKELRLVAFQKFPPQNIFGEILAGRAKAFPSDPAEDASLDFNVDWQEYFLELEADTTYQYIVVAHRFGEDRFSQQSWRAVAQYDTDTDSLPTAITLEENEVMQSINIHVDFNNLPIQPFED